MNSNTITIKIRGKTAERKTRCDKLLLKLLTLIAILSCSSLVFSEQVNPSKLDDNLANAQALLQQSNYLEEQAKQSLLSANKTRQLISKKRVEVRKEKDSSKKVMLDQQASELAKTLETQQKDGASQRAEALLKKNQAMDLFSQGLTKKWGKWINNIQPLTMDKQTLDYISHNAVVRSVHPTMLNKMGLNKSKNKKNTQQADAADTNHGKQKMSLRIASLVGQSAPADLDISAFQLSNDQNYLAHIEVHNSENSEQTNVSQVPLNQMHRWRLLVSDLDGNPISEKSIEVLGHMPGHVHGLPTQPQVTQELDEGVYLVEGVKFQMQGWWVMQFEFDTPALKHSNLSDTSEESDVKQRKSSFTFNLIL